MAKSDWMEALAGSVGSLQAGGAAGATMVLGELTKQKQKAEDIQLKYLLGEQTGKSAEELERLKQEGRIVLEQEKQKNVKIAQSQEDAAREAYNAYKSGKASQSTVWGEKVFNNVEPESQNNLKNFMQSYYTKVDWNKFPQLLEEMVKIEGQRVKDAYQKFSIEVIGKGWRKKGEKRSQQEVLDLLKQQGFNVNHPALKDMAVKTGSKELSKEELTVGKIYENAQGERAKYLGNGKWE